MTWRERGEQEGGGMGKEEEDAYRWMMGHIEHSLLFLKQVQHENMVHMKTNFLNVTIAITQPLQLKSTETSVEKM